jgi:anaerobic selenocysteine-containing dehydrogenase
MEIAAGLLARMRARGALTAEFLPWENQAAFNQFLIGEAQIDQDTLRRDGFVEFSCTFGDFAEQSIKTPSGKFELYSNTLAKLGLDPLPDHVAPLYARAATTVSADFPLVLQTGQREKTYHHSRFREQAWARKVSPDPTIRIHPETAGRLGLADGSWILVETEAGPAPCRLRAEVTDRTAPDVVTTGIGWWRPEASGPEFAVLDINVNAALTYAGPMDPMSGSVDTRALPCRLRAAGSTSPSG